ncbi:nuclear transport factor 2 family protein [Nocardia vulneris]|uniref:Steroid delta-isomerase n=1 Tax=Nocardia vulneris TaxID=1141657 RepID=A0ABR4ZCF3_9NOCA|nr:nuclear transport factor 2 family protein [Nocardia vulneris]KIA62956.1 steroid delta-isomerase [Nocardia vulneris]
MTEQIRDVVDRYVKLVGSGPTEAIVELYAPEATVEDPVGAPVRHGHDAIREFYDILAPLDRETELRTDSVRVAGNEVAFQFTIITRVGGQRFTMSPIDYMEFDDSGKIVRMRAFWSQDDMAIEPE